MYEVDVMRNVATRRTQEPPPPEGKRFSLPVNLRLTKKGRTQAKFYFNIIPRSLFMINFTDTISISTVIDTFRF